MHQRKQRILKSTLGNYQKSGDEFLFSCPNCKHHKKKLSINIRKDVYKCWICDLKGRGIHRLIRRYGSISDKSEWEDISPIEIPNDLREYIIEYYSDEEPPPRIDLPEEFETLSEQKFDKEYSAAKTYLYSRGLTDWDIVYWKIGYCPNGDYGGRVIIPSFDQEGNINYFVGRAYKDFRNKYKNPKVNKSKIIFNELFIDWTQDVTLVEGVFDAMKADNAIPILGSSLTKTHKIFQEIIRHDTPIFVALDKDAIKKAFGLIEKLIRYELEVYKIDTSRLPTDVGDLTKEEFSALKKDAVLMDSSILLKEKLRNIA